MKVKCDIILGVDAANGLSCLWDGSAVAYYNIACYHSLLIAGMPNEKERLLRETKEALAASNEYDSGIANAWRTDVDLKVFRESETDFSFGA